ncbi:MBL fold metallo-hydrolase [Kiloniella laminariae]|uniref:MBL fold metallo-hydrolase n=1 Tax=Kiloniella laminariae TaxID=454162 RepID=A0ABT4LPC9_9PROT|nr:MBL fold metallo-hydrolase [Kiloniella laminariae]MCZ4282956.1 MBL fold metallo-hydrolase [Kiloniella laminariae]
MQRREFLKASLGGTAASVLFSLPSNSARAAKPASPGLEICWLGGATMLICFDGLTLLSDPAFGEGHNAFRMGDPNEMFDLARGPNIKDHLRKTQFPGIDLAWIDHLLISHLHEDHFDQKAEAVLDRGLPVIAPVADTPALKEKGFSSVRSLAWGESVVLPSENGEIVVTGIPAEHSENQEIAAILGQGNGYWFEFRSGEWRKSLYWTGDSFATETVKTALNPLGSPDILVPHLGAVGTTGPLGQISMGAENLRKMIDLLKPGKILPIHHSSYELYLEPIWKVAEACNDLQGLDLVSEGTWVKYL